MITSHITNVIQTAVFKWNGDDLVILHEIPPQIEGGYDNIRDCTVEQDEVERKRATKIWQFKARRKLRLINQALDNRYHVTCGADGVICHVLLFLITA